MENDAFRKNRSGMQPQLTQQEEQQQEEQPFMDSVGGTIATFRPNLAGFTPTKIRLPSCQCNVDNDNSGQCASNEPNNDDFPVVQVNATNDFATVNYKHELTCQHWIDWHFLEESLGREQAQILLSTQVNPPSCRKLMGTFGNGGAGEQVLGTLSRPLSVSCKFDQGVTLMDRAAAAAAGVVGALNADSNAADGNEASTPRKRQQELLRIQQVQESNRTFSSMEAVDNDNASQRERQLELLLKKQSDQKNATHSGASSNHHHHQPLRLPSGWVNLALSNVGVVHNLPVPFHISFRAIHLTPSIVALSPLSPNLFPEHYQRHVFWTSVAEQLQQLKRQRAHPWERKVKQQPHSTLSSQPIPKQQQKGMLPPLHEKACACCFQPKAQVRCGGGCLDVFYCDKVCQQGHWTVHKKSCPQQQASFKTTATAATSVSSSQNTTSNGKAHERNNGKKKWWNKS